jgi:ribonuclease-3
MGKTGPALPDHLVEARHRLQEKIGYHFNDDQWLNEAMTHPSITANRANNQRLEFLGDRVINLIIADAIFEEVTKAREGVLTRLYADCVDNSTMAELARGIGLGDAMEAQDTALTASNKGLADALEALLGAIWRDGGLAAAKKVTHHIWGDRLIHFAMTEKDAKTRLQEYALAHHAVLPEYVIIERSGPDHAPELTVEVTLAGQSVSAQGTSRRHAEQAAAQKILDVMSVETKAKASDETKTSNQQSQSKDKS